MSTLTVKLEPLATDVRVAEHARQVILADGRKVSVPLVWFPRLQNANTDQRRNWRLIGGGIGMHWPT